jgi:hypothetical protein
MKHLLIALVLAWPAVSSAQIPPQRPIPQPGGPARDTSQKTGTAQIRGHVYAAQNGQALRRAQVRAFSPDNRENRLATTDAQGAYEFKDLPAGRYTLTASKGSYVSLQYGQTRPLEPGKPLEILDAQTVEKVDFALPHGSIITGRVVDEFGEPVADVQVAPMRYQFMQGRRRLMPTGRTSQTNDIGEFRIFGLPPGQYFISATMRSFMMMMGDSDDRSGYAPTYYPGTPNIAEAQRVNVGLGEQLMDINIPLTTTRTARVSGTVVDSQGRPLSMGMVMVMSRGNSGGFPGMPAANGQIKPDGTFSVNGLAPGEYTLRAMAPGDGTTPETAMATVTVGGDDVTGVQLAGAKMVVASGRIVLPDAAAAQSLRPSTLNLMAMPANPDDFMMGGGGGRVRDDLTFELRAQPGIFMLRVNSPMPGWGLKAVRLRGVDVTDTGIDFGAGSDLTEIEVELTNNPPEVSGVVTNARSEPVKDYSVVFFPQDREKWTGTSRYLATGRPDQDGRFKVRTLPPGSYYAIAVDFVDPGESSDPEFLDRIRSKATSFTLRDGEGKVLDLKLVQGS